MPKKVLSKNQLLMAQVVTRYHPRFRRNQSLKRAAVQEPTMFNVERLVEEALAHVGGYQRIDQAHADFSDRSDSKTCSISSRLVGSSRNCYQGFVVGVVAPRSGQRKSGALRCTVYNPVAQQLMYYYLPRRFWHRLPVTGSGSLSFKYNRVTDTIPAFERYRVDSFRELALAQG